MASGADSPARGGRCGLLLWAAAGVAGVLLGATSLRVGFLLDDYSHLAVLERADPASSAGLLDLWSWADGGVSLLFADPPQGGWMPWYTAPDLRIRFFRPLSAVLHAVDFALFGRAAVGWHCTTVVLWLMLLGVVGRLYVELGRRDGSPPWLAPLALLLFALDDAHAWNLGWLANRHSLVACLLAVTSVVLYLRWRAGGGVRPAVLAAAAFVAALAASENGVAVLAWLLAAELCLTSGRAWHRLARVAPFVAAAVAYAALHRALGYGVAGLSWYADPLADPLRFLFEALPRRGLVLAVGLLTPFQAEASLLGDGTAPLLGAVVLAVVVVAGVVVLRGRAVARFLAAALVLALPVAVIPPPLSYMLLLPSVAAMWLVARLLAEVVARLRARRRTPADLALAALAGGLAVSHLAMAPWAALGVYATLAAQHEAALAMVTEAESGATTADQRVVVLTTADPLATLYLPLSWRTVLGPPGPVAPAAVWALSSAAGRHRLLRTGAAAFELSYPGRGESASVWDAMVGDPGALAVGERRRQGGLAVTVLDGGDGRLRRVRVELDRPLDADEVRLLAWDGERLARVTPPPVGQEVAVGPHPLLELLRRRGAAAGS